MAGNTQDQNKLSAVFAPELQKRIPLFMKALAALFHGKESILEKVKPNTGLQLLEALQSAAARTSEATLVRDFSVHVDLKQKNRAYEVFATFDLVCGDVAMVAIFSCSAYGRHVCVTLPSEDSHDVCVVMNVGSSAEFEGVALTGDIKREAGKDIHVAMLMSRICMSSMLLLDTSDQKEHAFFLMLKGFSDEFDELYKAHKSIVSQMQKLPEDHQALLGLSSSPSCH